MDPRANIERQREIAQEIIDGQDAGEAHDDDAVDLAEHVLALDEWRRSGGFDPYAPGNCEHCKRPIEIDNIHGKPANASGYCVGTTTCLQRSSVDPSEPGAPGNADDRYEVVPPDERVRTIKLAISELENFNTADALNLLRGIVEED